MSRYAERAKIARLDPLPVGKLDVLATASSGVIKVIRRMIDNNYARFTREVLAPMWKDSPPIKIAVRSQEDIEKSLRSGQCVRDDIVTKIALASWSSIAGSSDDSRLDDLSGFCVYTSKLVRSLGEPAPGEESPAVAPKDEDGEEASAGSESYSDYSESDEEKEKK
jgi:hypothetical protein